jgi:hypothetical protein
MPHPLNLFRQLACAGLVMSLVGCAGNNTRSAVDEPGAETSSKTKTLEAGAALLQDKPPLKALNTYLDGFHFYNGNMHGQMEAHHYCSILNEEVIQCVIYDGNVADAKIMGVEYIISERLFKSLPEKEKPLWHSHGHEVKSGQLVAPGIPQSAEHALMGKIATTYGKTWHTWHTDQDKTLPLGVPQLMMGFTADGQIDERMVEQRDKRMGIDFRQKRKDRADIPMPAVAPGANAWEKGNVIQIQDPTGADHRHHPRTTSDAERERNASSGK